MKNAQQVAAQWAAKMAQAGASATAGAQSVTESPGMKAAAQKGAYAAGVQQSADKWAANVAAVSVDQWRQSFIQKGIPRMAEGARQAQGKVAGFMQQLLSYQQSALASLPPRGPKGSNQARMMAWHDKMMQFKKQA